MFNWNVHCQQLPFKFVESSRFKKAFDAFISSVPDLPVIRYNQKNLCDHVLKKSEEVDSQIRVVVKNMCLDLKLDCATSLLMGRSFLHKHVCFCWDLQIYTISLGCIEIEQFQSHIGEHIKDIVPEILEKYGISIDQIVSVTTDNGSNVLKCVEEIGKFKLVNTAGIAGVDCTAGNKNSTFNDSDSDCSDSNDNKTALNDLLSNHGSTLSSTSEWIEFEIMEMEIDWTSVFCFWFQKFLSILVKYVKYLGLRYSVCCAYFTISNNQFTQDSFHRKRPKES